MKMGFQVVLMVALLATSCVAQAPSTAPTLAPTPTPPAPAPVTPAPTPVPTPSTPAPAPATSTPTASPSPSPSTASAPAPGPSAGPVSDTTPSGSFAAGWVDRAFIAGTALAATFLALALA